MSFPAYPGYKDSGVDWLGHIPEGWSIKPLWALFRRHKLTGFSDEQLLSVYRDYGVIPKASRDDNFNKPSDDLGAYQLVQVGDLAINKMKAWQGSVGISSYKGIVSPAYHVYAPSHSESPQYLHHLFRCNEYIAGYLANSKGIRVNQWDLEPQQHSRMSVLLPPLQEQIQIARFLDHETARIDALIEEQQRLIELLREKRQAVISRAVTKGLDLTVPMKDSGVEWLGDVPAHWQVGAVGYFAGIDTGATPDRANPEYWGGDIPWIKTGEVNYENISQAEEHITSEGVKNSAAKVAPKGTLLMAMYGQGVTRGRVAILDIEAAYNQACAGIFVDSRVRVEFLRLFFIAAYPYVRDGGNETSQMNLSSGHIAKIKITVPPVNEQISVEHFLDAEMLRFDSLIHEAGLLAEHLQERRSAIISAAVTGKIDVRGWQPPASVPTPQLAQEAV
jgi:type I restriction enzyme S subunit